jgi:hypothetical protein
MGSLFREKITKSSRLKDVTFKKLYLLDDTSDIKNGNKSNSRI